MRAQGFTMIELVVVMVMLAILAAVAMPNLQASVGMRDQAWHDALLSAVRHARNVAVSHRRVVCLTVSGNAVTLSIATSNPAVSCNAALTGPDGGSSFAASANSQASTTVTQGGTAYSGPLYFQPDGRVSTNLAGTNPGQWRIDLTGADSLLIDGVTGHAR